VLQQINLGQHYLDYGPVQMTISAFSGGQPLNGGTIGHVEAYVCQLLEELTVCLDVARQPVGKAGTAKNLPPVLLKMLAATRAAGDNDLTSMAAVAGAFADAVADFLVRQNASRIIVNNGGDIALRLTAGENVMIGLNPSLNGSGCSHALKIGENSCCGGVATSGLGGRGFTKGIASAVTVLAGSSSLADACATSIANHTTIDDPAVSRLPAEVLDPQTDIRGRLVTVGVSALEPGAYEKALLAGIGRARQLLRGDIIMGVIICAGPYMSVLPESLVGQLHWRGEMAH